MFNVTLEYGFKEIIFLYECKEKHNANRLLYKEKFLNFSANKYYAMIRCKKIQCYL